MGTRTKEGTVRGDTNQRGAVAKNISGNFGIRTPLNIILTVRGDTNQRGDGSWGHEPKRGRFVETRTKEELVGTRTKEDIFYNCAFTNFIILENSEVVNFKK